MRYEVRLNELVIAHPMRCPVRGYGLSSPQPCMSVGVAPEKSSFRLVRYGWLKFFLNLIVRYRSVRLSLVVLCQKKAKKKLKKSVLVAIGD